MKAVLKRALPVLDVLCLPVVVLAAYVLKWLRIAGVQRMPACRATLMRIGVFPLRNHYYEPLFDARALKDAGPRPLPGIDWDLPAQRELLATFIYRDELRDLPVTKPQGKGQFYFGNPSFGPGDADFLYNFIRAKRPRRIIEIGSGFSTLIARRAIAQNVRDDVSHACKHICIEPYEMPWLEGLGIDIVRSKVEDVPLETFAALEAGDLLFIDSSHVIRPGGDVVHEYLEILPRLKSGTFVHIHDIFSPRDYPRGWLRDEVKLWNEQYLVEAMLSDSASWRVVAALNLLRHDHFEELARHCVHLSPTSEPASIYLERR